MQENLSSWFVNDKGADQPAHPRSLISAFVIRFFESLYLIRLHVKKYFLASFFSRADWFESNFFEMPEDRFCRAEAHIKRV